MVIDINSGHSSTDLLEHIWENSEIGFATVAENGYILAANPKFCELVEYSEVELQKMTYQQFTHPQDVEEDVKLAGQTSDLKRNGYGYFKRYITKTARVISVKLFVTSVLKKDGTFDYFFAQIVLNDRPIKIGDQTEKPEKKKIIDYKVVITAFIVIIAELITEILDRMG